MVYNEYIMSDINLIKLRDFKDLNCIDEVVCDDLREMKDKADEIYKSDNWKVVKYGNNWVVGLVEKLKGLGYPDYMVICDVFVKSEVVIEVLDRYGYIGVEIGDNMYECIKRDTVLNGVDEFSEMRYHEDDDWWRDRNEVDKEVYKRLCKR